jgi:uncharacterized membrane protein
VDDAASALEQRLIQRVLRTGLVVAVVLMLAGLVVRTVEGRTDAPRLPLFHLFDGDPGLVLSGVGVLVLALTPAFRVAVLLGLWIREKDFRFVGVAVAVLITLTAALVAGRG